MRSLIVCGCLLLLNACGNNEVSNEPKQEAKAVEAHPDNFIEDADVVELSLDAQKRAGIEVIPVKFMTVETRLQITGAVEPIDSRVSEIRPLSRGRVEQVLVKVGDIVSDGQIVVRFDNIEAGELANQLNTSRAELQRLRVQQASATRQAERSRSLVAIGAVPAKEAENAEADVRVLDESIRAQQTVITGLETRLRRFSAAGADPAGSAIQSPFSGVVTAVLSAPGSVVDATSVLLTVTDLSRVYVEGQVYERDLGKIRIGQAARIGVDAFPGELFTGRVSVIESFINPQTRTAGVRCEVDNSRGRLRLGMFANLSLPTAESHSALSVPADSVQEINRRSVVFVRLNDLHFEAREVQTSGDGPNVEIVGGLKDGEPVVTNGAFQLKSVFLSRQLQSEHEHDR